MDVLEVMEILVKFSLVLAKLAWRAISGLMIWLAPFVAQAVAFLSRWTIKLAFFALILTFYSFRLGSLVSQFGLLWVNLKAMRFKLQAKNLAARIFATKRQKVQENQAKAKFHLVPALVASSRDRFSTQSDDRIIKPIFARNWLLMVRPLMAKLSISGAIISASLMAVMITPDLMVRALPYEPEPVVTAVEESPIGGQFDEGTLYAPSHLPPQNPDLPKGNWLIIDKIGVKTPIQEGSEQDEEAILKNGTWRIPNYATPDLIEQVEEFPTILVAHRYGYLKWTNDFRRQHSFYNLDKLQIGDTFEIIWDQRLYTYEIYAGEEGKAISDYAADVILYTCKYLNAPVRIIRYARRVEW